jgi:hypothetical protein
MLRLNFNFLRISIFLPFLICLFLISNIRIYSQTTTTPEYLILLDSVKIFYGDTCSIGVSSNLIKRLYNFQSYKPVRDYLNAYEAIKFSIESFRKSYGKTISEDNALLLGISRIFSDKRQQNIVNACGIYLGPDSVTSVGISYIILRSTPMTFYSQVYQIANFDKAFRKEILSYGSEWYYSEKIKELIEFPIK